MSQIQPPNLDKIFQQVEQKQTPAGEAQGTLSLLLFSSHPTDSTGIQRTSFEPSGVASSAITHFPVDTCNLQNLSDRDLDKITWNITRFDPNQLPPVQIPKCYH